MYVLYVKKDLGPRVYPSNEYMLVTERVYQSMLVRGVVSIHDAPGVLARRHKCPGMLRAGGQGEVRGIPASL